MILIGGSLWNTWNKCSNEELFLELSDSMCYWIQDGAPCETGTGSRHRLDDI